MAELHTELLSYRKQIKKYSEDIEKIQKNTQIKDSEKEALIEMLTEYLIEAEKNLKKIS